MLRNGPEYVALVPACHQSGLFIASVSWHFKAMEANHILVDSGARALFGHADVLPQMSDGIPEGVSVTGVSSNGGSMSAAAASSCTISSTTRLHIKPLKKAPTA